MSSADPLRSRWPLPDAPGPRDELLAAYGSASRGYHDLRHLTEVLDRLDELEAGGAAFDRLPVVLAAWFHDGVYDGHPGAEERSATWAEEALGSDPVLGTEVGRLVRLTVHHWPGDDDANGTALCDADLAILAAPPGRYTEYVADVRREYAHVPDDAFRAGRAEVLRVLQAKPHLFHTAYAREHWEAPARANLARELAVLP